jgi:uncharacterized protein YabE (DUF348 family)
METIFGRISNLRRLNLTGRVALVSGLAGLLVWVVLALAPQPVLIRIDGRPMQCRTLERTVGATLAEAGVVLRPQDAVQPDLGSTVTGGMVITVNRAVCVDVRADGRTVALETPKMPLANVLRAAGITVGPLDRVNIPLANVVADGMVVTINRVAEQIVSEHYQVPVPVERINDPQMERGESRVVRNGVPGMSERQIQVTFVDGRPASRSLVKTWVLLNPVSRLIAFGTLSTISRGGNSIQFQNAIDVLATAYSFENGRYTCTGQLAHFGVVAVDPRVIPLGTRLYIEGYGYATAADIGGVIKGDRVDLFFDSGWDAERWGRRYTKVYVLQ